MKILHTSDWHLGKKLFKVSRLPEQKLFLAWLEQTMLEQDIDALVMAGDVFDTPHPPHDALELYYQFLESMDQHSKKVFIIAGNHDSGRFLQAPNFFLKNKNIHVVGRFPSDNEFNPNDYVFKVEEGKNQWFIHLLPFFRSHEVLEYVQRSKLITETEFPRMVLEKPEQLIELGIVDVMKRMIVSEDSTDEDKTKRMLVSHHLFGGFRLAGSEQSVSISGLDGLPSSLWGLPYDDLAIGHIHQTQRLREEKPRAIYPGSPIRFRFNEKREKKISILEWSDKDIEQSFIEIPEFRPVISLKLDQEDLKTKLASELLNYEQNYELAGLLEIKIKASGAVSGLADEIRDILSQVERPWELLSLQIEGQSAALSSAEKEHAHLITNIGGSGANLEELFKLYYKKKYPSQEKPSRQLLEDFKSLIEELERS